MKTTLVDIQAHPRTKFDIWIGRTRLSPRANKAFRTHKDERLQQTYEFAAPYHRHGGEEDWKTAACKHYKKYLRAALEDERKRKRFLKLRGKKLGVWGEFGLMTGAVVLDMLKELGGGKKHDK